ncbi:MAG: phosphonate metabolism protein (transferase hexapeptide repeat family) [Gammaproteobacteria bacterium]|jgi:phosphonate metabolism protein (transferase hexapeptide repeat family)
MSRLSANDPVIHGGCLITETTFGAFVEIGAGSRVVHSDFQDYSYCDRIAEVANASIGKFANIASFSRIGATDHPLHTASCHHFLYRSHDYWDDATADEAFFKYRLSRRTIIGNDTWIGHGASIKPEVTLGHGAVVATGAVVTKDVAPYTIVAGVPAKVLRLRQPPEIAQRLIGLAWWDWTHDAIRAALPDFRYLTALAFLEKYDY